MHNNVIHPAARERSLEAACAALLVVASVTTRLMLWFALPSRPVSDFQALVAFAAHVERSGSFAAAWYWDFFGIGLPAALAPILYVSPLADDTTASLATAALTGVVCIFPCVMWRDSSSFAVRFSAAVLLAFWPGLLLFSPVVAQDNWVLLPVVFLACLAARGGTHRLIPIGGAVAFVTAFAIRPEMLVVLLPLLIASAGWRNRRNVALALIVATVLLSILAAQRRVATGRWSLTSDHGGVSALGAYVPGATANWWIDPRPWAAARSATLADETTLREHALELIAGEIGARPWFQLARIATSVLCVAMRADGELLYWRLLAPGVMPPPVRGSAEALSEHAGSWLHAATATMHGAFFAAIVAALVVRDHRVLILGASVALKVAIHAVTVIQGRYFIPVIALELLVIALSLDLFIRLGMRRTVSIVALAAAVAIVAATLEPHATSAIRRHDHVEARP